METRPVVAEFLNCHEKSKSGKSRRIQTYHCPASAEHKEKTATLLNAMLNEDITRKEIVLLLTIRMAILFCE